MAVRIYDGNGNPITSTASALDVNVKSGTTLPVSATSLPLPTGAAQDGTDGTGIAQPAGGAGIRGWLSGIYKALINPLAVTGTFFPATQPVSAVALPLPVGAAQESGGNLASIATSMTNGSAKTQTVSAIGTVMDVTAKGVQGANFAGVQQPKDSGRTPVILTLDAVAGVVAEALATMTINKGGTVTTATQYTVTAGKTLRIQSIFLSVRASAATLVNARARLRSAGTVNATSPLFGSVEASTNLATIGAANPANMNVPDGVEIAGGQQVGISQIASATSTLLTVTVIGYEY